MSSGNETDAIRRELGVEAHQVLMQNLLPFWEQQMERPSGRGFWGAVDEDLSPQPEAVRGAMLLLRMLWSYSRVYSAYNRVEDLTLAQKAYDDFVALFWDPVCGGCFFSVNSEGVPLEVEKRCNVQAYCVYALCAYYHASGQAAALKMAQEQMQRIRTHAMAPCGGCYDSLMRDWSPDDWILRWEQNPSGCAVSLSVCIHLLEACGALFEITRANTERQDLRNLLLFFIRTVYDPQHQCLKQAMTSDGRGLDHQRNFGAEAEFCHVAAWAAGLLDEPELTAQLEKITQNLLEALLDQGIETESGLVLSGYDDTTRRYDDSRVWWCQCEAINALLTASSLADEERAVRAARRIWNGIKRCFVDWENGEWFIVAGQCAAGGPPRASETQILQKLGRTKASRSKCPYHSFRTCLLMQQSDELSLERNRDENESEQDF